MVPLVLVSGLAGLYRVSHSPSFAAYRRLDVVRLVTVGVYVGVVMVALGMIFMRRHDREQPRWNRRRFIPLFIFGIFAIDMIPQTIELYRAVDVVQLTGSGVCFGVALGLAGMMIRLRASKT